MYVAAAVLAVLLGVGFAMVGLGKVVDAKPMAVIRRHLGVALSLWRAVGALEILGGVGLLVGMREELAVIGVLAAVGLIGLTIGAGFYHHRAGDGLVQRMPPVVVGSLAIMFIIARVGSL